MNEILSWIGVNYDNILFAITATITAATAIARLTPTQKDDTFIEKVRKVAEWVANLGLPDVQSKKK